MVGRSGESIPVTSETVITRFSCAVPSRTSRRTTSANRGLARRSFVGLGAIVGPVVGVGIAVGGNVRALDVAHNLSARHKLGR